MFNFLDITKKESKDLVPMMKKVKDKVIKKRAYKSKTGVTEEPSAKLAKDDVCEDDSASPP